MAAKDPTATWDEGVRSRSVLNLFYEEPDTDRWLPFDRYPRRLIRRSVRSKRQPGGPERVFLNLRSGLEKLGVPYRVNDYKAARKQSSELAGVIGKPHVLDDKEWRNPIVFGSATFSHPVEQPNFLRRHRTIRKILVPGEWMRRMWEPYYGDRVEAWPVGIDTSRWSPSFETKRFDFLIYDKIRWKHEQFEADLIGPICAALTKRNLPFARLRYGTYREEAYEALLRECRSMIFLCEHETQGIAYQQALSAGVPILAWDRGGFWQDPAFYPDKVRFGPVSSVPYWDNCCGLKFANIGEFHNRLDEFLVGLECERFAPRDYILENLTLENCAQNYLNIWHTVTSEL